MTSKYKLTDEHRAQIAPWAERWVQNALNCEAMTDVDRAAMCNAVNGLYDAAGLDRPLNIVFARGPVSGAIAAGISAGVWWLRGYKGSIREIAVGAATHAATHAAVGAAMRAAVRDAVDDAVGVATHDAVDAATYDVTYDVVGDAVDAAVGAAVRDATDAAVRAATHDAMRDAVDAAVGDAVDAATRAAVDAAVHEATRAAVGAAVGAAVDDAVSLFLIQCIGGWWKMRDGGNQWSGYVAYLSFFRHIAKLEIDYSKWEHYESAAIHGGVRYMHEKFCIVCDRPEWIYRNAQSLPHNTDGPFCRFRDGIDLYYVHGIKVPREWVEEKENLDPRLALTHDNVEQRRALVTLIGWDRILESCAVKEIGSDQYGTLLEADLQDDNGRPARFVRVVCPSSGRVYVNRVPGDTPTVQHGLSWRFHPDVPDDSTSAYDAPPDWYAPTMES